jgi:SAM-dependent methyltransferase
MRVASPAPRLPQTEADAQGFADMYNKIAALEKTHTLNQVNCLDIRPADTVLDSGCGPGRLAIPFAQRAKSVTALDINPFCLEQVKKNAEKEGAANIKTVLMDWTKTSPEEIGKHDIVICSRSSGLSYLEDLSAFSKRVAAIISWGDGPNIPQMLGELFKGTAGEGKLYSHRRTDRRLDFNVMFNIVYDLGYAPNVKYVEDGFTADFKSFDEAYAYIRPLGKVDDDKFEVFKANLAPYLTQNADGSVTFLRKTESIVMWWDVNHRH